MTASLTTPPAGTVIGGRYELLRALGQGSFGRTFLARDREASRDVAIKVLDHRAAGDWKARELFDREAVVLRSLRHQGVPEVHDVVNDSWEGSPATFLVMEYVEGDSLAKIIAEQRLLEPAEVMHIFLELLGILEYLHGLVPPILHRDIKPSNVIRRPDGRPALVDFGSVRRVFLGPEESGSTVAGTYGYMPYEQYMGQASPTSDLYALGATFLHLLTGRPPKAFMSDAGRVEVPATLPGEPRLRPILARLLRTVPTERFASARDVRDALLAPGSAIVLGGAARSALTVEVAQLGAAPRALEGETKALFEKLTPSMWALMDSSRKSSDEVGASDWLSFLFFSVLTVGILPVIFSHLARTRRRRLTKFFKEGTPAAAEVIGIQLVPIAFDEKLARVSYQFEADGEMRRDADDVLPVIANKWQTGDRVQILYLPEHDHDSVIISTR